MTTADIVMERALAFAQDGTDPEQAVRGLLNQVGDRRVAVVMARRHLLERFSDRPSEDSAQALELLDLVLSRLPEV